MWFRSFFVALCLSAVASWAQVDALITMPYDGQTDVSPSSGVRVRAPSPILASSVSGRFPKTSRHADQIEPTFMVIRKTVQETVDRSDWGRFAIIGTAILSDEQTVDWKPRRLMPGTSYHCVVRGLLMQTSSGVSALPMVEFDFTTSGSVPKVSASTMDTSSIITCQNPIWIRLTSSLGDDVAYHDLITVEQPSADGSWARSDQAQVQRVAEDLIAVAPRQGWRTGVALRARVAMSKITGDINDDRRLEAIVRGASRVVVTPHTASNSPLPESVVSSAEANTAVVTEQDRIVATMPAYADERWRFVRWECEALQSVSNVTTSTLDVSLPCHQMRERIDLKAIYEFIDTVAVTVVADSLGSVDVTDQDGRILTTVVDSATITAGPDITRLLLVARSTSGTTFSSWTSPVSGIGGNPAPTISIPVSVLVASAVTPGSPPQQSGANGLSPNQPHVYINPKFQKLTPLPGERYRLRARLMNSQPEEQHPIDQHIQFTTPQEFEEPNRQTRSVCVVADECWEIIGYHDAAVGPPVWFTKGRRELCVESELLDPENTLVIFGRRIPIDLRIERVLLSSENDHDVIQSRHPNHETRIDVDRQIFIKNVEHWLPITATNCVVEGIAHSRIGLRCGDKVRITVRPSTKRGEQWRWWSMRSKYIQPRLAETVNGAQVFTLTVAENLAHFDAMSCDGAPLGRREIAMRAAFRQQFVVDSIALRVRVNARGERFKAEFKQRWFDPFNYYDRAADEPAGCRQLEYIAARGTTVKLRFSRPLDVPTVYAGGITANTLANILHTDPQAKDLDFSTASGDRGNTTFFSSGGQFLDIVEFSVFEPGTRPIKQALHMGVIDLQCHTSIRSADNEPLVTPSQFTLNRMEIPGFGLRMMTAKFEFDGDTDWTPWENSGEVYHALYGMNIAQTGPANRADGFVRFPDCLQQQTWSGDCTVEMGDAEDDIFSFGDREIWAQTAWMDADDIAFARIGSWDEDCKNNDRCLVNRIQDVLNELRDRADQFKRDQGPDIAKTIPADLIALAASLINALLPIKEQDDHLGEATYQEGLPTLWGMSSPTAPRIQISTENADYRMRGVWFTSRAVVR